MGESEMLAFCRARLDEDEQVARRAGDSFRQIGETGVIVATDGDRAEECASANWAGIAEHIVRHDPARTLQEVEAKRFLLEQAVTSRHLFTGDQYMDCPLVTEADGARADHVERIQALNDMRREELGREAACIDTCGRDARVRRTLELFALPYSDHPEYEEAVRP